MAAADWLGRGRDGPAPLSPDQERMWLFDQQQPASCSRDDPLLSRLRGPFSLPAAAVAVNHVAARHESLRTRFVHPEETGPCQVVDAHRHVPPLLVDLSQLAAAQRQSRLAGVVEQLTARPFDLQYGRPLRWAVIRLAVDDHVLALVVHHLAADLWSMKVLVEELSVSYEAVRAGTAPRLPAPAMQPVELAERARHRLTPARRARLRERAVRQVRGVRAVNLPTDHPRWGGQHLGVHVYRTRMDGDLSAALRRFSRAAGVTLFVTMLAGFAGVLRSWTGQHDLVIRSVSAGRHAADTERTVGMLTRCLVLRLNAPGDPTFDELVVVANGALLDALDGSELPLGDLVAIADPGRVLEPSPLRQLGLSLHNVPAASLDLSTVTLEPCPVQAPEFSRGVSEADLWLEVSDHGNGPLDLQVRMDDRLYEPGSLPVVAQQLAAVLSTVVSSPVTRMSELALVGIGQAHHDRSDTGSAGAGSQTPVADRATTRAVRRLVAEVLNVGQVAAADNVFGLGATSVDAARLAALIRVRLRVGVSLHDILRAPTVDGIAAAVTAARLG